MEKPAWIQESHDKIKNKAPKIRKDLQELKEVLANRAQIQLDITKLLWDSIGNEWFKGEKIQVIPDFKDKTVIYIKTSHAQIQIDLHYDETKEHMDSLRKNSAIYPEISITGEVDGEIYEVDWYDEETSWRIAGELLKQIERKKHPEVFWYKEIQFWMLEDKTIILGWKWEDWKTKRLGFFDFIDDKKDHVMLYGYISHYFWNPLDPKVFEEPEYPDDDDKKKWLMTYTKR